MIVRDDVMPLLLLACPSFNGPWQEYVADSMYEPELLYLDLAEFSRHLVRLLKQSACDEFPAVFAAIEQLHVDGDEFVREAATIGLLEAIQNNAGHANLEPDSFVPWLGPESKNWWEKLDRFWDGDFTALRE